MVLQHVEALEGAWLSSGSPSIMASQGRKGSLEPGVGSCHPCWQVNLRACIAAMRGNLSRDVDPTAKETREYRLQHASSVLRELLTTGAPDRKQAREVTTA